MNRIRVGIVGLGNLGKSLENLLLSDSRFALVRTFTKKDTMTKENKLNIKYMKQFQDKIDILFLCVGSKSCLENIAIPLSQYFNILDAYDNHKRIVLYNSKMSSNCVKTMHTCINCCGWDPGLLSIMRLLFHTIDGNCFTFWGKGVSQGHTQAIKEIDGVDNAIQFTLPNKKVLKKIKKGNYKHTNNFELHKRLCFVETKANKKQIKNKILNMPDYFKGYKTKIKFVKKLDSNKSFFHSGSVLTLGNNLNFSVKMKSNPDFTAKIMLVYSIALFSLFQEKKYDAFSVLDIPIKYLDLERYKNFI